jgi:hypothetical protein
VVDPLPTSSWSHVDDGRITGLGVAFDARGPAPPD